MKYVAITLLMAISTMLMGVQPIQADSMSTSAPMMMTMPKCPSGDSVVAVNMTTKMYMTQTQMKAKMSGMSTEQQQAMMKKNNMKMMCKSQADAMGAKMMKPPM